MSVIRKVRKGVKAAKMAMKDKEKYEDHLKDLVSRFLNSKQRKWMYIGERYYRVENDIEKRKMKRVVEGKVIDESYKSNNKLAHANYKNMVDEKVQYVLGKEYTLDCTDAKYLKQVQDVLGKRFKHLLMKAGYAASNKAIAWLHPYIDEQGRFKIVLIPSEKCVPEWADDNHEELKAMHYVYDVAQFDGEIKKYKTHIETWTAEGVICRVEDGKDYVLDFNANYDEMGQTVSHFQEHGEWTSWGRVPWVPIKNNDIELPDIAFVKSLIDNYDKSRSEAANYVEDTKNLIFILKGYKGTSLDAFLKDLNEKRAIALDADEDEGSGVDALTPTMDITALREHYEQLKRDIIESGQGVIKDIDKFGSAPSGVALKFMYSGLDLKASALVMHLTYAFEEILYFVNKFLGTTEPPVDINITFNLDMKINETEKITNLNTSRQNISQDTYLANHPYVKDVEKEKELINEELNNHPFKDKVPIGEENGTE